MMLLDMLAGGLLAFLLVAMLWTCCRMVRQNNIAVAAEPFLCPRCGHIELTIHAVAAT